MLRGRSEMALLEMSSDTSAHSAPRSATIKQQNKAKAKGKRQQKAKAREGEKDSTFRPYPSQAVAPQFGYTKHQTCTYTRIHTPPAPQESAPLLFLSSHKGVGFATHLLEAW